MEKDLVEVKTKNYMKDITILLVEDDFLNRRHIKIVFTGSGNSVSKKYLNDIQAIY